MAQPEFHRPECFDGSTTDEIHERMMASLPDDIDDMPAGFPMISQDRRQRKNQSLSIII